MNKPSKPSKTTDKFIPKYVDKVSTYREIIKRQDEDYYPAFTNKNEIDFHTNGVDFFSLKGVSL